MSFFNLTEADLPKELQPQFILEVEKSELNISAGLQDRVIQVGPTQVLTAQFRITWIIFFWYIHSLNTIIECITICVFPKLIIKATTLTNIDEISYYYYYY